MVTQNRWPHEPVAQHRTPWRRYDRVAVVVSAVLLLCLTVLLIVGTVAVDEPPTPPQPSPGASSSGLVDG